MVLQAVHVDPSLLEGLRAEIKWGQHEDLLPDGRVILQPRLIAYQADDPSLAAEFERWVNLGDDRNCRRVYVRGRVVHESDL